MLMLWATTEGRFNILLLITHLQEAIAVESAINWRQQDTYDHLMHLCWRCQEPELTLLDVHSLSPRRPFGTRYLTLFACATQLILLNDT